MRTVTSSSEILMKLNNTENQKSKFARFLTAVRNFFGFNFFKSGASSKSKAPATQPNKPITPHKLTISDSELSISEAVTKEAKSDSKLSISEAVTEQTPSKSELFFTKEAKSKSELSISEAVTKEAKSESVSSKSKAVTEQAQKENRIKQTAIGIIVYLEQLKIAYSLQMTDDVPHPDADEANWRYQKPTLYGILKSFDKTGNSKSLTELLTDLRELKEFINNREVHAIVAMIHFFERVELVKKLKKDLIFGEDLIEKANNSDEKEKIFMKVTGRDRQEKIIKILDEGCYSVNKEKLTENLIKLKKIFGLPEHSQLLIN